MEDGLIAGAQNQTGYGTDATEHDTVSEKLSRQDSTESLGIDGVDMGDDEDDYDYQSHHSTRLSHDSVDIDDDGGSEPDSFVIKNDNASHSDNIVMHPKAREYDFWLSSGSIIFWFIFVAWMYVFLKAANYIHSSSESSIPSVYQVFLILLPILLYLYLIVYPLGSHVIFDPEVSRHQLRRFLCKRALQHLCIVVLPTACLFTMFVFGLLCEFSNGMTRYCGPMGSAGGIIMFFLGSFGLPCFWFSFLNVASYSGHFDQLPRFRIVIQISLVVSIIGIYLCVMGPFMIWLVDTNTDTDPGFAITDVFYQAIVGLFYFGMFCQAGLYITFHDTGAGVSLLTSLDRPIRSIKRWYLVLLGIPIGLSYFAGNLYVALKPGNGNFFGNSNGWAYFEVLWTIATSLIGFYVMFKVIIIYLVELNELKLKISKIDIPSLDLDAMRHWHNSMLELRRLVSAHSSKFQYMALIIVTSDVFLILLHAFLAFLEDNMNQFYIQVLCLTASITVLTVFIVYDMLVVNTMILDVIEIVRDPMEMAAQDDTIPSDMYMQLLSCVNVWKMESKKMCVDVYGFPVNKLMFFSLVCLILASIAIFIWKLADHSGASD